MRGIIKKIALLIAVLLVIFIFTSTIIATFIFPKEKIYEKSPENSLLNTTSDASAQNNPGLTVKPGGGENLSEETAPAEGYSFLVQVYNNDTMTPVTAATVNVGNLTGTTNKTGIAAFKFTELEEYLIIVKAIGYENYSSTVLVTQLQTGYANIYLTPKAEQTPHDEFNVGGSPANNGGGTPTDNNSNDTPDNFNETVETGTVSGRILQDNKLLSPIYNASVLINEQPAEIYGATYLALNVTAGQATLEAHDNHGHTIIENISVEPFIINSIDVFFPANTEGTSPDIITTSDYIQFIWGNALSVELNLNNNRILGIGDVNINGTPLRKPISSGTFTIEKIENGTFVIITYTKCQYLSYETKGKIVIVHSQLITTEGNISIDWIFTPWNTTIEGNQYTGLGYRFSIISPINISKMGFKCSWEINENISGKTLLTRREKTDWERSCTQQEGFNINTNSLLGQSQPPDYQYDDTGALASYIWPPCEVRNILQKNNDSDQLWSYDEFSFGETKQAETPLRLVFYANKGGIDEYTYLLDQISQDYRKFYGLNEVELVPTVLGHLDAATGAAPPYRTVADTQLPEYADHNFKHVSISSVWKSNGRIGAPYDENRLATHSIDVHPDDVNELKYFFNKTHNLDMELSIWLSICYSQQSPDIPVTEWRVTNVDGSYNTAASGDVYVLSYRSGYLAYALEKLKAAETNFGCNGIWHDSFTQGFDTDYSASIIKPSIDPLMQFLSATQRMGYAPYLESIGPFGMTAVGSVAVTPPGSPRGDRDINAAFKGKEYLAYKTAFTLWHPNDYSPMQIDYYRFIANKACPMINYAYLNDTEKDNISQANKDYNAVSSYMDKRHVLSNDTGILWYDNESTTQVLFAYNESSYTLEGGITEVFDITSNTVVEINSGSFTTQPKHTYTLQ